MKNESTPGKKMKRLSKWLFRLGLLFFISGLIFAIGNRAWYRTRTWTAVDLPLTMAAGSASTPEFTVNIRENFLIELAVDRSLPREMSAKLLGIRELGSETATELRGVRVKWDVLENGKVIKQGLSDGRGEAFWSAKKGRILGFFPAQKGPKYRVDVDVLNDGSALSLYHPELAVHVDLFEIDGYAMGEGIAEAAGIIAAAVGLALVALSFVLWGWLFRKKTRPSAA